MLQLTHVRVCGPYTLSESLCTVICKANVASPFANTTQRTGEQGYTRQGVSLSPHPGPRALCDVGDGVGYFHWSRIRRRTDNKSRKRTVKRQSTGSGRSTEANSPNAAGVPTCDKGSAQEMSQSFLRCSHGGACPVSVPVHCLVCSLCRAAPASETHAEN